MKNQPFEGQWAGPWDRRGWPHGDGPARWRSIRGSR
jgi:hypothetical protein